MQKPGATRYNKRMVKDFSGEEPAISGAFNYPLTTEQEPMLGGERMVSMLMEHQLRQLANPNLSHNKRAAIGEWLAQVGDPRPGIGLRKDGLPDLDWCFVKPGEQMIRSEDTPRIVKRILLARYPVTWQQYAIFLNAADGHEDPRWWPSLRRREEYPRMDLIRMNYPVQEVSWYDAVAYCRWLSTKLGYIVRLPTEWEWQRAATDGDPERLYPWGRGWDMTRANTRESSLRGVSAVGLYPRGKAPSGAFDMCGTVLEWCANTFNHPAEVHQDPILTIDYIAEYERQVAEQRLAEQSVAEWREVSLGTDSLSPEKAQPSQQEALCAKPYLVEDHVLYDHEEDDDDKRVARGGSWFSYHRYASTSFRTGYDPYFRFNSVGFRLVTEQLDAAEESAGSTEQ